MWPSTTAGRDGRMDVAALPAALTGLLPEGIEVEEAVLVERREDSLQQMVTSCSWTMRLTGSRAARADTWWPRCWRPMPSPSSGSAKVARSRTTSARRSWPWPWSTDPTVAVDPVRPHRRPGGRAGHPTPRGAPVELIRGLIAVSGASGGRPSAGSADAGRPRGIPVLDRACRTQQWIERDGLRRGALLEPGVHRPGPTAPARLGACVVNSFERDFDVRSTNRATGGGAGGNAGVAEDHLTGQIRTGRLIAVRGGHPTR